MGKFDKLAKFLGLSVEKYGDDAAKILSEIKTDVQGVSTLENPQVRKEYMNALEDVYGSQIERANQWGKRQWYHGTTVPIEQFEKKSLGSSTGAKSAEKGFFFSSDPSTASDYANLAKEKGITRQRLDWLAVNKEKNQYLDQLAKKYNIPENEEAGFFQSLNMGNISEMKNYGLNAEEIKKMNNYSDESLRLYDLAAESTPEEKIDRLNQQLDNKIANRLANGPNEELAKTFKEKLDSLERKLNNEIKVPKDHPEKDIEFENLLRNKIERAKIQYNNSLHGTLTKDELTNLNKDIENLKYQIKDLSQSSGQNVLPVRLRANPEEIHIKNYKGQGYRDTTYAEEMDKAREEGKKGVLFKNTYDPADPSNIVKQDIATVFEPNQIRSEFAAFDPRFKDSPLLMAGGLAGTQFSPPDISPIPLIKQGLGAYEQAKEAVAKPLARQLNIGKNPEDEARIAGILSTVGDPINYIPGAAGAGLGALQMLTPSEEEIKKRALKNIGGF